VESVGFGGSAMNEQASGTNEVYSIFPIGYIRRSEERLFLEIQEPFRPAMKQLDKFSHLMVFWWADKHDNKRSRGIMQTEPPYAKGHVTGVFATRAEYRPNPIAMTTTKIIDVNEERGVVRIGNIDAFDGTPIVDLKAYFPVCDRVEHSTIPEWLSDWPEWMPDEGLGL
jgi:tRNA-Thr(GGU) m(6)t(6)A37 methyltransferase TsaA